MRRSPPDSVPPCSALPSVDGAGLRPEPAQPAAVGTSTPDKWIDGHDQKNRFFRTKTGTVFQGHGAREPNGRNSGTRANLGHLGKPRLFENRSPGIDQNGEVRISLEGIEGIERSRDRGRGLVGITLPSRRRAGDCRFGGRHSGPVERHGPLKGGTVELDRGFEHDPQPGPPGWCILAGGLDERDRVAGQIDAAEWAGGKQADQAVYERYKSDKEGEFLWLKSVGLDGKKAAVLEDGGKEAQRALDLMRSDKNTNPKALTEQESLVKWWDTSAAATAANDKTLVEAAGLFGGRQALKLTALVPAMMLLCYLALLAWFKSRGGYQARGVNH
jgi:hypothetical protein